MSDMDRLIEAVEAGADLGLTGLAYDALGTREQANRASDAFHGSLDAAKRLHDALLPGWKWDVMSDGQVCLQKGGRFVSGSHVRKADNPARAWLLAILRAVKAKAQL